MKEVRSLTTTQDRIPSRAHSLDIFDQLGPVLIWSILNREIRSKEDIGSDN